MGGRGGQRKRMRERDAETRRRGDAEKLTLSTDTEKCFARRTNQIDVCITNQMRRPKDCHGCAHYRQ